MIKNAIVASSEESRPWIANRKVFWVFNALTLSWLFRIILTMQTKSVTFKLDKFILK